MNIKVKEVVKYHGHSLSANGSVNLTFKAGYSELTKTIQTFQMLNNDVYDIDKYFVVEGGTTPSVADAGPSTLTYAYANIYTNSNANYEEQVRLKYGADQWLKFTIEGSDTLLTLQADSATASVFSWGYLQKEYSLLNSGTYPEYNSLTFGFNRATKTVKTQYKAYSEYSMLLDNTLTYLGRTNVTNIPTLRNPSAEWKTDYTVTYVPDSRFSVGASGLSASTNSSMQTTVTAAGESPTNIRYPAGTGLWRSVPSGRCDTLGNCQLLHPQSAD